MRFTVRVPDVDGGLRRAMATYRKAVHRAALIATDKGSKEAQRSLQKRIEGAGLGRLGRAVGQTSALRQGSRSSKDNPYGVIFARGGDESPGGGVLEAYSQGASIVPRRGDWLWIPARAIPKFVSFGGRRVRNTPQIFRASPLVRSIGKLQFVQIAADRAIYFVERVTVSPKTGRAKADTGARVRSRIRKKREVAFIGIRNTNRAKRFDKDEVVAIEAGRIPEYIADELERLLR